MPVKVRTVLYGIFFLGLLVKILFQYGTGNLAGPESGHLGLGREFGVKLVEGLPDCHGRNLHLQ